MRPWWVRLICLAVVALIWGGLALWRVLRARKANDDMAEGLAQTPPGDVEAQTLAKRLKEALATLKTSAGNRRDYLYSRPWYVIIGPPGAGKTTALLNSGLRFPFAESALQGVGGTRNLDFWFADEAVLVDTAGRYTTQDRTAYWSPSAWTSCCAPTAPRSTCTPPPCAAGCQSCATRCRFPRRSMCC
jgi:type VI secretion system protein ImpL